MISCKIIIVFMSKCSQNYHQLHNKDSHWEGTLGVVFPKLGKYNISDAGVVDIHCHDANSCTLDT